MLYVSICHFAILDPCYDRFCSPCDMPKKNKKHNVPRYVLLLRGAKRGGDPSLLGPGTQGSDGPIALGDARESCGKVNAGAGAGDERHVDCAGAAWGRVRVAEDFEWENHLHQITPIC